MDTNKIDILNNIIDSEEIKSYEKSNLKVSLRKIKELLSIIRTLEKLKEILKEIEYNENNLNIYDECISGIELNNQIINIYTTYQRINRRYYNDLIENNINISDIDFEVASNKLSTAIRKLEVIVEKE